MVSRNRAAVGIGALAVGIAIGVAVGFALDQGPSRETGDTPPSSSNNPGPTSELNGIPVGYSRTEKGAVAAAANFTLLTARDELLDEAALTRAMETMAAPGWEEESRRQAQEGYEFIVETYGDDAEVSGAILRYALSSYTPDSAVVRLWAVSIASGSLRPSFDEIWSTLTVELVWTDGDWRVEGTDSAPGPTPDSLTTGASEESARDVMEEFNEFQGAPIP